MTKRFVAEGAAILAVDRSGAENSLPGRLGPTVVPVHCDVSDESDVCRLEQVAAERFGGLDVLCNNAGVGTAELLAVH
jgi:NAD(P)-dependent dehydrogenase (short-subunit alcohol dehydrogenase family)